MREIFLNEIRNSIFSGKAAIAFFLMLIAFLISLGMMSREYQLRLENYGHSLALPGKELFWNKTFYWRFPDGGTNNTDLLTFPMGKVKEPDPMIFFARGLDTEMRQSVEFMRTFPIIDMTRQAEQEKNLFKILFQAPDLLFMVKVLVSLLAMIFAFNIICGEREKGTLKLMLASGASRGAIFAGKFLGGMLSLWAAFTAAFLIYLLALSFLTPVNLTGEIFARIAFIYLVCLLQIAVFFSIAAAISAFTRSSGPALVLTLFFWLMLTFVLPGISSLLAQQLAPVNSEQKVARMKLEKAQAMEREYEEKNPGSASGDTAGYGTRHDEIRHLVTAELQKIDDEHQRRKELQNSMTSNLARISPAGSLSQLMTSLSRTGIADEKLYNEDLQNIRQAMEQRFTEAIQSQEFFRLYNAGGFDLPQELRSLAAEFFDMHKVAEFRRMPLHDTLAATWLDFGLLAAFTIIAASLTFTRFIFYDPR